MQKIIIKKKSENIDRHRNVTFSCLEAIAIIMVIDDHTGRHIDILSNVFPYNSFYMPLFVFISGYFYKKTIYVKNIKSKIMHLFVPYMICALIGNAIAYLLDKCNIVHWYENINGKNLLQWITICPPSTTSAGWFAIMLVWVSISYSIIQEIINVKNKWFDYLELLILVGIGMSAVYFCMEGYSFNFKYLPWLRMLFYLQFYHFGIVFKKYWEIYIKKMSTCLLCGICIFINLLLIYFYGYDINFSASCWMANFNSYYLPVITSLTGILFWYKIMHEFSENWGGGFSTINFFAKNTFWIMESHLFFINIPSFYTWYKKVFQGITYSSFDQKLFESSPWMGSNGSIVAFFTGVIGSAIFVCIIRFGQKKVRLLSNKYLNNIV